MWCVLNAWAVSAMMDVSVRSPVLRGQLCAEQCATPS